MVQTKYSYFWVPGNNLLTNLFVCLHLFKCIQKI